MTTRPPIPSYSLDETYFFVHKKAVTDSGFGLDHTPQLINKGFGLYSCVNLQDEVGPLKSNFYRLALCLSGSLDVQIGLETFQHEANTIHFHIPGQVFQYRNKSANLDARYLMFTPAFLDDLLTEEALKTQYPFFDYLQTPFFALEATETQQISSLLAAISDEIRCDLPEKERSIKLLLNLALIAAKRSYLRQGLVSSLATSRSSSVVLRFKKRVGQHFITHRNVQEYAAALAVSPSHLHKLVKAETGKSPGELIDDMLIMEIKALLRHSNLTMSEIAYQLSFTDTSHLAKFFRKYVGLSPSDYRHLPG